MIERGKRGQAWSFDAVMAFLLFFMALVVFWNNRGDVTGAAGYSFREMAVRSEMAAHFLADGPGTPMDWNSPNVLAVGLAADRGVIDEDRLAQFLNLSASSPETAKELLGTAPFSLYFAVSYANGTPVFVNRPAFRGYAVFGSAGAGDRTAASSAAAIYKGNRAKVQVVLGRTE